MNLMDHARLLRSLKENGWVHRIDMLGHDRFEKTVGGIKLAIKDRENGWIIEAPAFESSPLATLEIAFGEVQKFEEEFAGEAAIDKPGWKPIA